LHVNFFFFFLIFKNSFLFIFNLSFHSFELIKKYKALITLDYFVNSILDLENEENITKSMYPVLNDNILSYHIIELV
jgi:hypothetical protein